MSFLNCSFYELSKPPIDERVIVIFNTYDEMNIKGKLNEYKNELLPSWVSKRYN